MYQESSLPVKKILMGLTVLVALACLFLVFLTFLGYGFLTIAVPKGASVLINGHTVSSTSVKLRPGNYTATVYSPMDETYQANIKINLFLRTTLQPELKQRDPNALISSVIGSYGDYGPPTLSEVKWYNDNSWLAGNVGPGSGSQIALHYINNKWVVAYFNGMSGYPTDKSKLPLAVAEYINEQAAYYAAQ